MSEPLCVLTLAKCFGVFPERPKQTNKVLLMVIANHQLATAFRRRNTSNFQGYIESTEVVPYQ